MYEILYKDQVIARDENIDIYLEIIKFNFFMEMVADWKLPYLHMKGTADWLKYYSSYMDICELNFSNEMLNYHIKNLDNNEVSDVIDMFTLREVFPAYQLLEKLSGKYPMKEVYEYDKNQDALIFDDTMGYHCHRVDCGEPLNEFIKEVKNKPWYYTDEVKKDFKRYSTYCKDELIGRSDSRFKVLCDYIGELDEIVENEWHQGYLCVIMDKFGQKEWYHGESDKKGRRISDFYIKDLLTGEVITDFRALQYFYVNPKYDWESDYILDEYDPAPLWEENVGVGKEFDWSSKYGQIDIIK